jgi:hypothetical protein
MRFILGFVAGAVVYCFLDKTDEHRKTLKPAAPTEPTPDTPVT